MSEQVLVFAKRFDEVAHEACQSVCEWLTQTGYGVLNVSGREQKVTEKEVSGVKLGIAFGGDGTFLTLVRLLEKKDAFPLLGVNLGTLGFITEVGNEEVFQTVDRALRGDAKEQNRLLLDVSLSRSGSVIESGTVFNDAFVTKDARSSLMDMNVFVQGEMLTQVRADGYIVATPIGSTGYALSAGSPLIHPQLGGMILIPICAHSLSSRPILVPDEFSVEIELKRFSGKSYLCFDGQVNVELSVGDRISVRRSNTKLRLIPSENKVWGDILREKLNMN